MRSRRDKLIVAGQATDDLKWILKNNNKSLAILSFFIIHENFRKTIYPTFKKNLEGGILMINKCQAISQTKGLLRQQYRSFHVPSCSISTQFLCSLPSGSPGNQLLKVTGRLEFSHLNWPSSSWSLSPIHTPQL